MARRRIARETKENKKKKLFSRSLRNHRNDETSGRKIDEMLRFSFLRFIITSGIPKKKKTRLSFLVRSRNRPLRKNLFFGERKVSISNPL